MVATVPVRPPSPPAACDDAKPSPLTSSGSGRHSRGWHLVHTPRLAHRHAIAHAPHAHKNVHIKTGYMVHATWQTALRDAFTLHNETANIVTAWVGLGVAAYLTWAVYATPQGASLLPLYRTWVLYFAAGCAFNSVLVTLYHMFNSIPAWYDVLSALDLLAISGCALTCVGSTLLIPGASIIHDSLAAPPGRGGAVKAVVEYALRPLVAVVAPAAAATLPPWEVVYWVITVYAVAVGAFVTVRRMLVPGESPKWALFMNVLPITVACVDHCLAAPLWWSPLGCITLVGGGVMYAMKFPERWFTFREGDHAVASRLIDLAGHSHMVWHIMYGVTFLVTGVGTLTAAVRASAP